MDRGDEWKVVGPRKKEKRLVEAMAMTLSLSIKGLVMENVTEAQIVAFAFCR